jgi:hypothetical protein
MEFENKLGFMRRTAKFSSITTPEFPISLGFWDAAGFCFVLEGIRRFWASTVEVKTKITDRKTTKSGRFILLSPIFEMKD